MASKTIFGREVELQKRVKTELPRNSSGTEIGALGQVQITQALDRFHRQTGISPRFGAHMRDFFPEGWQWSWFSAKLVLEDPQLPADKKGEHKMIVNGVLTTRLQSFYYKVYGISFPDSLKEEIGNYAKLDTPDVNTTVWDITTNFDWRAGAFADGGSCYWSDRHRAKDYIVDNGGAAIRFFRDEKGEGIGRAWLVPYKLPDGSEAWTVFNGYGASTQSLARFFATSFNKFYKKVRITVDGQVTGVVFINADGYGYIVGDIDKVGNIERVNFEWDAHYSHDSGYSSQTIYCAECDNAIGDHSFQEDGTYYCPNCWWNEHFTCNYCDDMYLNDDGEWVASINEHVCSSCINEYFVMSDYSNEYFERSATTTISVALSNAENGVITVATDELDDFTVVTYPERHEGTLAPRDAVVWLRNMGDDEELAVLRAFANDYVPVEEL